MRVTKKDYELFKTECDRFVNLLGLKEWSIHYSHEKSTDNYASTYMNRDGMVATIVLGLYWDDMRPKTEYEIKRLALHEVCHLLMNPLVAEAQERYTTEQALASIEHTIIRRIENLI